jgi:hypothetical protein
MIMTKEDRMLLVGNTIIEELKKMDMFPALIQLWEEATL